MSSSAPQPAPARRPLIKPVRGVIVAGVIGALAFMCGVALTATSGWLIVRASQRPIILTLLVAIVGVRTFGIGRPVFRYIERLVSHNAALDDLTNRRTLAYKQLVPLTPARLGHRRRADLLSGVVRDLDDEVDIQVRVIVPLMTTFGACLAAVVAVFLIHPASGWVVLASVVAAGMVGYIDFALEKSGQAASLKARGQVDRVAHLVSSSAGELAAIGAKDEPMQWLMHAQNNVEKAAVRQARGRAVGIALALTVTGVSTVALGWTLDGEVRSGHVSSPLAALLLLTPLALGDVVGLIPDAVGSLARSSAARDRLESLLTQTPAVKATTSSSLEASSSTPTIELNDLTARWNIYAEDQTLAAETREKPDSGPITLRVRPGEHIAITGPNGCGKSTLLAVLARQLDPASGTYAWNGRDVTQTDATALRAQIAVVDDDPHVFAGTLRANLALANPNADDGAIRQALGLAGLGGWLSTLPEGLDTLLGEHLGGGQPSATTSGSNANDNPGSSAHSRVKERSISGGERARLGMARALLSGRSVILLDEPVAHLDTPTADAVIRDLLKASAGRTVIMVSHHPIAFDAMDRVIDLGELTSQ